MSQQRFLFFQQHTDSQIHTLILPTTNLITSVEKADPYNSNLITSLFNARILGIIARLQMRRLLPGLTKVICAV